MNRELLPLLSHLFCVALFCLGSVALYASRWMVMAVLVLTLLVLVVVGPGRMRQARWDPMAIGAFVCLLVLAGLSAIWSQRPEVSLDTWWRVVLVLGAGAVLMGTLPLVPRELPRPALNSFCLGLAVLVLLLILEWTLGGSIGSWLKGYETNGLPFSSHATALLAVLVWPALAWLTPGRRLLPGIFAALVAIAVALMPMAAASVSLAMGAMVWILIMALGQRVTRALLILIWLTVLGAPLLFSFSVELSQRWEPARSHSSWSHRLVIWQFFAERVRRRPVLGHGLGSSKRTASDPASRAHYERLARPVGGEAFVINPPLHPHNSILQLWHDLGALGALCVLSLITAMFGRIQGLARFECAWMASGFVAWSVIACVSFGLWQKWWLAGTGIACAIAVLVLTAHATAAGVSKRDRAVHA